MLTLPATLSLQACILEKLAGVPNIIQLVARQHCSYQGETWHALLLKPYIEHLSATCALPLMAQVRCQLPTLQSCLFAMPCTSMSSPQANGSVLNDGVAFVTPGGMRHSACHRCSLRPGRAAA